MSKFNIEQTKIEGLFIIQPTVYTDNRGYFMETYNYNDFAEIGLNTKFIQDNQSKSKKGVLRGLHFQKRYPQAKLVRVIRGEVFDVVVDLRERSKTFGKWYGITLNDENKKQLYSPEGFAHGFLVMSDEAEIVYKCSNFYNPSDQNGVLWNDSDIGIDWKIGESMQIILSDKDKLLPKLKDIKIFL